MDDIDLIRDFHSDFRGPDADETARVGGAVQRRIAADRQRSAATPRRRLPRRRWLYAAAAAAAIVAAAVIIPQLTSDSPLGGVQSAAADALNKVADVAAGQQATAPPAAGQFVYTKTRAVWEADTYGAGPNHDQNFAIMMPVTRESWIGPDGSGRLLETNGAPSFRTPDDRSAWVAAGRPDLRAGQTSNETYGKGGLSYVDLSNLPTDTAQLRQLIVDRKVEGGPAGDAETFTIIGDLLRETWASPALRAALYRIASELPGVQLVGTVQDQAGRSGTAVAYTSNGVSQELIFDPATSALMGEESVVADPAKVKPTAPAGTVLSWSVQLASGVVDSTSQAPSQQP